MDAILYEEYSTIRIYINIYCRSPSIYIERIPLQFNRGRDGAQLRTSRGKCTNQISSCGRSTVSRSRSLITITPADRLIRLCRRNPTFDEVLVLLDNLFSYAVLRQACQQGCPGWIDVVRCFDVTSLVHTNVGYVNERVRFWRRNYRRG